MTLLWLRLVAIERGAFEKNQHLSIAKVSSNGNEQPPWLHHHNKLEKDNHNFMAKDRVFQMLRETKENEYLMWQKLTFFLDSCLCSVQTNTFFVRDVVHKVCSSLKKWNRTDTFKWPDCHPLIITSTLSAMSGTKAGLIFYLFRENTIRPSFHIQFTFLLSLLFVFHFQRIYIVGSQYINDKSIQKQ